MFQGIKACTPPQVDCVNAVASGTYGIHTSHFMTGLTDTGHPKNWACDSQNKCSQAEDYSGIDAECFSQLSDLIVNYEMCEYHSLWD